jgi:hypothetical protein
MRGGLPRYIAATFDPRTGETISRDDLSHAAPSYAAVANYLNCVIEDADGYRTGFGFWFIEGKHVRVEELH